MRHSFGVAEIAHGLVLCLNKTGMPVLALLTRRSAKEPQDAAIRLPYPEECKRRVCPM